MKLCSFVIIMWLILFISAKAVQAQFINKDNSLRSIVLLSQNKQQHNKRRFTISNSDRWFSKDKADHFLASALITAGCLHLARSDNNWSTDRAAMISISVPLTIGIGKEIWDGFQPTHVASMKDVIADIAGIGVGYILFK